MWGEESQILVFIAVSKIDFYVLKFDRDISKPNFKTILKLNQKIILVQLFAKV